MANDGGIKIIRRPPSAQLQFKAVQQEIAKQLQAVGRRHVDERRKVVDDFDTKIEFGYDIKVSTKQITLTVKVTNAGAKVSDGFTVGDLWKSLDQTGVKPHVIRLKRQGGKLRFQTGYSPHTRPVGRSGGPGRPTGPTVYARQVQHPGFAPRKFSDSINKRLRKQFVQAVDRGVRLGYRRRR